MRVVKCTAATAATVLLSTAHHVEATEWTPGIVSGGGSGSGGIDAAYQQPLMHTGPGETDRDGLLRSILDLMRLDLDETEVNADVDSESELESQDFKACAACEVRLLPVPGPTPLLIRVFNRAGYLPKDLFY